jgi:benzoyl-CoA reductase/2-hydroxyglutaryl-CoA dehydratase subunit BcrC/BadD/HgdB
MVELMNAALKKIDGLLAHALREVATHVAQGTRVIGYVGDEIPVELILAAGAVPVRLMARPDTPTQLADRYIEPSFSPESRSIADQWLQGRFDAVEAVIFPRTEDSWQRLYYYLCELQRAGRCAGPKPLLCDLPKVVRPTSHAHAVDSMRQLAAELNVDEARLPDAMTRVASRRALVADIAAARSETPPPRGSESCRAALAALHVWSDGVSTPVREWLDTCDRPGFQRRIVLVGSRPVDHRIHAAVERAGACIVGEINESTGLNEATAAAAPTLEALAAYYHENSTRSRARLRSSEVIRAQVESLRVDAAIIWMIEEDTGIAWELPQLKRSLQQSGIPTLVLSRQLWAAEASALDACAQFAATLELPA